MDKVDYVVVGNLSFDYNYFPTREKKEVMNLGGATLYSGIPASMFLKVGIAANVGEDYNFSIFDKLNFHMIHSSHISTKLYAPWTSLFPLFSTITPESKTHNSHTNTPAEKGGF